jgi:glycosyltransferase involved in cell wall biosynthesis
VLSQKTNFPFHIVIADDCSPDGTREIIRNYANRYPDRITLLLQQTNKGAGWNFHNLIDYPNSPFIAYMEGDDYWISDEKLQIQYDTISADSTLSVVYADSYRLLNGEFVEFYEFKRPLKHAIGLKEFLLHGANTIPSCTALIRKPVIEEFLKIWVKIEDQLFHGDFLLWCIAGKLGDLKFIDQKFGVYRVHQNGIMRSTPNVRTLTSGLFLNHFLVDYLGPAYKRHFLAGDWWYHLEIAFLAIQEKQWLRSIAFLLRSLISATRYGQGRQIQILRDYLYRVRNRRVIN